MITTNVPMGAVFSDYYHEDEMPLAFRWARGGKALDQ